MIAPAVLPVLWLALAASPPPRLLAAGVELRDSLAGGESVVFAFEVPPETAARVVIQQDGIDLSATLRRAGSDLPRYGLDLVAGTRGEELVLPPVESEAAAWHVILKPALPQAPRGDYTIALELAPADDRARALAAARQQHHRASDVSWIGDAKSAREAQVLYGAAAEAALAAGDRELAAEATYQCARTRDTLGDVPSAIEWQRRALALFREVGRSDRESRVLNRLGDLTRKEAQVLESAGYFEAALPKARESGDLVAIADILNNSGLLKLNMGRIEEALDQFQAGIPLAQQVGSANVEAALLNNMADAYLDLGVYDKAIESGERALEVTNRLNLPRRTGRTLHLLARNYFLGGDRAKAEATMLRALEVLETAGDKAYLAEALTFEARLLHATGQTARAKEALGRALPLLRELNLRGSVAGALVTWAEIEIEEGDVDPGLARLEEALALNRLIAPDVTAKTLYQRALGFDKKGRLDDAIQSIAEAIENVESVRGGIVRSELRATYLAAVREYFDLYVDLLQRRGSARAAFEASERSRARTFLEGLAESASKIQKGADPELLARQRQLQVEIAAKESLRSRIVLKDGEQSPRGRAVAQSLARLLDEWKDTDTKLRIASPAYWAFSRPEPIGAERVQSALLDAQSALVEYHLGAKRSYAWVIDRQQLTVHELPRAETLDQASRRYHELLSRELGALTADERDKLGREVAVAGLRLAALVWKPLEARVAGKRLLIVADGALQYVPFAALPTSTGEPLLARHEIVYLPSASVLETIRRDSRPLPAAARIAVFADPVFSKSDVRIEGAKLASQAAPQSRSAAGGYPRLRFSRREAEAISAVSPGAFEALDFEAAKATLRARDLRSYRILHFATHGVLDTARPELSGLVLSLVAPSGQPVDGFLRLYEIYNLDLDADLVVLSACRTALGKEVHGEGLIGLTRGFMYAGASRVVSSVWNVDDRASALLMSHFYKAMLAKQLTPAAALRDAQLSLLRDPRWSNPHHWAAFGLQGEWK